MTAGAKLLHAIPRYLCLASHSAKMNLNHVFQATSKIQLPNWREVLPVQGNKSTIHSKGRQELQREGGGGPGKGDEYWNTATICDNI